MDYLYDVLNVSYSGTLEVYGNSKLPFRECFAYFNPTQPAEFERVVASWAQSFAAATLSVLANDMGIAFPFGRSSGGLLSPRFNASALVVASRQRVPYKQQQHQRRRPSFVLLDAAERHIGTLRYLVVARSASGAALRTEWSAEFAATAQRILIIGGHAWNDLAMPELLRVVAKRLLWSGGNAGAGDAGTLIYIVPSLSGEVLPGLCWHKLLTQVQRVVQATQRSALKSLMQLLLQGKPQLTIHLNAHVPAHGAMSWQAECGVAAAAATTASSAAADLPAASLRKGRAAAAVVFSERAAKRTREQDNKSANLRQSACISHLNVSIRDCGSSSSSSTLSRHLLRTITTTGAAPAAAAEAVRLDAKVLSCSTRAALAGLAVDDLLDGAAGSVNVQRMLAALPI
jgi:hypothetical protein